GARPLQLASEVLVETALVAAAGGILGIGLARWLIAVLVQLGPRDLPRASHAGVDPWVAAGALLVSVPVALAAALAPALQAGRGDAREALAEGIGSHTAARARRAAVLFAGLDRSARDSPALGAPLRFRRRRAGTEGGHRRRGAGPQVPRRLGPARYAPRIRRRPRRGDRRCGGRSPPFRPRRGAAA